jgi:hypothetical protein
MILYEDETVGFDAEPLLEFQDREAVGRTIQIGQRAGGHGQRVGLVDHRHGHDDGSAFDHLGRDRQPPAPEHRMDQLAQQRSTRLQDPGLAGKVLQRDLIQRRQRMIAPADEAQFLIADLFIREG